MFQWHFWIDGEIVSGGVLSAHKKTTNKCEKREIRFILSPAQYARHELWNHESKWCACVFVCVCARAFHDFRAGILSK